MKKKYKDWILGLFLSAIVFYGIVVLDRVEDIQKISPFVLFVLSFFVLSLSIKFINWVFKS